jgi:hypothetical protein
MSANRPFCDEDAKLLARLDAMERSAKARLLEALGWFAIGAILAMPFAVLIARCGEAVQ